MKGWAEKAKTFKPFLKKPLDCGSGSVYVAVYSTQGVVRGRQAVQNSEGSFSAVSTPIFADIAET